MSNAINTLKSLSKFWEVSEFEGRQTMHLRFEDADDIADQKALQAALDQVEFDVTDKGLMVWM